MDVVHLLLVTVREHLANARDLFSVKLASFGGKSCNTILEESFKLYEELQIV